MCVYPSCYGTKMSQCYPSHRVPTDACEIWQHTLPNLAVESGHKYVGSVCVHTNCNLMKSTSVVVFDVTLPVCLAKPIV